MKHRLLFLMALLLMVGYAPAQAQKPEITIKQVLKLGNPYKVLKKANVQPITYQLPSDSKPYIVAFGRNVEWEAFFVSLKPTGPDALGINNNDIGSGAWEIVTTHTEWLDAYVKEAKKLGYVPYIDYLTGEIPSTLQWTDVTDYDTGEVIGRHTQMLQLKRSKPTDRVIDIIIYNEGYMRLQFGWEFGIDL
ncbi:MAG: hypothetical protein K6D91_03500 [Prevotella sp.]|nr:hypothetical protein [Prevotella sp.]